MPSLDGLGSHVIGHGLETLKTIPSLERRKILEPIFFVNDNGRVVMNEKKIVQSKPPDSTVAVRERVNVFKLAMKVGRGNENVLVADVNEFGKQFIKLD